MTLSVIIVSYNVRDFLENCLASVRRAMVHAPGEVIVVDNASDDGSVEMVRRKFPDVTLIESPANRGFAAANNIAMARASGGTLILLNPDTVVQEDTFATMLAFLRENPEAGMAGCRILNPDGTLQPACRRSFPTPWAAFTKVSGLAAVFPRSKLFARYNLGYLDPDATYEVDAISGSFMAVRAEAARAAGPLDERFFMYGEDLDWCYRIKQAGWKVFYVHVTQIIHYKGESVRRSHIDEVKYFYDAMRIFVRKHHGGGGWSLFWLGAGIRIREWMASAARASRPMRAAALDLALMTAGWLGAEYLWFGEAFRFPPYAYPAAFIVPWTIVAGAMYWMGVYTTRKHSISAVAASVLVGYTLLAALTFFLKEYAFSRIVLLVSGGFDVVLLCGWRLAARKIFHAAGYRSRGLFGRTTLVVGANEEGIEVVRKLRASANGSYDVVGYIDTTLRRVGEKIEGVEILGSIDNIEKVIQREKVSDVIFSTDVLAYQDILSVISRTGNRAISYRMVPTSMEVVVGKTHIDRLTDLPFIEIQYNLHRVANRIVKRLTDLVLGAFICATIWPWAWLRPSGAIGRSPIGRRVRYLPRVLSGTMSLVGPTGQPLTHLGKPGLTSLADINRRSRQALLGPAEREQYDVFYAKNHTPALDLEIIFRSLRG